MLRCSLENQRERLSPLGERNVAIPFWMASKQFIPGRPPIQKHQRIHFLLLNPDYIVEIFVSRILVAPLAQPPLFNGVLAKRKTTPRGRVALLWVLREDIFYPSAPDNLGFRFDRERDIFFVRGYLRYSSFFVQRCRAVSSQRFRPWNWKLSLVFLHRFHEINPLSWWYFRYI